MDKKAEIDRIIGRSDEIRARNDLRQKNGIMCSVATVTKPGFIGALRIWFINYSTTVIFMGVPMLLLVPMFFIGRNSTDEKTRVISLWLGGIIVVMLIYLAIHFLRTFPSAYRAWHFRPGYPVTGMKELFETVNPGFWEDDAEQWINCAITVKLKGDTTEEAARVFASALTIFTDEANGAFYGASGADTRNEWVQQELRTAGSADGRVLFRLRKFLSGEMAVAARHYVSTLESVEITCSGGFFIVTRDGYSGDGTAT